MGRMCHLPFNSLELSPDGTVQVCCKIDRPFQKPDGTKFNLVHDQLSDIWNSEDLRTLRQEFLSGEEPKICSKCWVEEQTGNFSLRQQTLFLPYNEKNPKPVYVSLKLSNKCNLACRICGPHLSSLWQQEFERTSKDMGDPEYFKHVQDDKLIGANLELFHKWAPNFEHVLIYGGEPLINEEVLNFLDHCADTGIAKKIHLVLNTNGTMYSERLSSKLSQFKQVSLFFSIDDIGPRFEYQRWPARWEKVTHNIERFCAVGKPIEVRLFPTFSILNVFYLEEILNELSRHLVPINILNIIHEPGTLALRNAPPFLKQILKLRISKIDFSRYQLDGQHDYKAIFINNIDLPADPKFADTKEWYRAFQWQIGSSDIHRAQSFIETFPELHSILLKDLRSSP